MQQMNKNCRVVAICLQDINELVTTVQDGQQKMWAAIERISKDLQELIQNDASTNGEDDEDPVPMTINQDVAKSAPTRTFSTSTPWSWLTGIPKEDESSFKDSVTSGLPYKRAIVGGEVWYTPGMFGSVYTFQTS